MVVVKKRMHVHGVVYKIKDDVARSGSEWREDSEESRQCEIVRVIKLANETAFERQFEAIKSLEIASDIVQLTLGEKGTVV